VTYPSSEVVMPETTLVIAHPSLVVPIIHH
jgi:hypothetical protein